MADFEEQVVGGMRIQIDRGLCVGFGDCLEQAPGAFRLDGDGIVTFTDPAAVDRDILVAACDACPVDAISVWDSDGNQLVP